MVDLAHIPPGLLWFAGVAWLATIGLIWWGVRKIIGMISAGDLVTRREHERVVSALDASEEARSTAMGQINDLTATLGRVVDSVAALSESDAIQVATLQALRDAVQERRRDPT